MSVKYPEWDEIKNSLLRGRNVPMIEHDMPTFLGQPHAVNPEELENADVVIIGSPYVASWGQYGGVGKSEWIAAPKRVRQQSVKYPTGYIQEFGVDVLEELRIVDFGDADIPPEVYDKPTVHNILRAQKAVEEKVNQTLDAGAIPIVIGQNSPCGSYAIAKPIAERTKGNVGVISLDTHWDIRPIDTLTMDPRIAGSGSWKAKMYEFHENMLQKNLVEIGERGMYNGFSKEEVLQFLEKGTNFYPMWKIREKGIEWMCTEVRHAYEGTESIYVHFDMDVIGGAGPASGDIMGTLAEPIGMTDYEVLRLSLEIGKRGFNALSFICIPPGSPVVYRLIVYVIMYMLAGKILSK
jgi:agmatinase